MVPAEMTARIVAEALATLRAEADERVLADRMRRLCDDATTARSVALYRRRLLREEWNVR